MAPLLIPSFQIQNFRTFHHLKLEHLGQVNLIVGKNNVGKTSLLEALRLYAGRGTLRTAWDILLDRGEITGDFFERPLLERTQQSYQERLMSLFHNYPTPLRSGLQLITLRSSQAQGQHDTVEISLRMVPHNTAVLQPMWEVDLNGKIVEMATLALTDVLIPTLFEPIVHLYVSSYLYNDERTSRLWDQLTLTEAEGDVLAALQLIEPRIQQINFRALASAGRRIPFVRLKTKDNDVTVPLRSLGEGVSRLFSLSLALATMKNGLLLIDEIDNGLHYSVMEKMWRFVMTLATRLNIQVFATTHSDDCVSAFRTVSNDMLDMDGVLISLRAKEDDPTAIVPVIYQEEQLVNATRFGVEVR